jgi:hypothetical protein
MFCFLDVERRVAVDPLEHPAASIIIAAIDATERTDFRVDVALVPLTGSTTLLSYSDSRKLRQVSFHAARTYATDAAIVGKLCVVGYSG